MTVIDIDETTEAGRDILRKLAKHPEAGQVKSDIPLDENGEPIGYTLEEVFADVDKSLSEAYGVDFAKVSRLVRSGELKEEDITNELLLSAEFEYMPYPGFKPKRVSDDFEPDALWIDAISDEE
ncbi:MAG: efflux RND transporter permease subunit [Tannerellaceae bacterium]|jgi:hypothetical protein|nr:efflux RND transporter permease subunit [Tannerellaceae bacterium]